jgi:hypothetical protein
MRIRITFTPEDMIKIHDGAAARNHANRLGNVVNQKVSDSSDLSIDFVGLLGEVGFSRIFGLPLDESVGPRSGSVDFVNNGVNIEVKSSKHKTAHLLVPAYLIGGVQTTKEVCQVYVLMLVDIDRRTVEFAGWTTREQLINPDRLGHFKGSMRKSFIMHQDDLTPLDEVTARTVLWVARKEGHNVELTDDPDYAR